jgi:tight adherence protein C
MSDGQLLLIVALSGLAGTLAIVSVVDLARPEANDSDTRWRDPAPPLFRFLMPLARRYGQGIRLSESRRAMLESKLGAAGLSFAVLPEELVALRWLFAVIGGVLAAYLVTMLDMTTSRAVTTIMVLPLLGAGYPAIWLRDAVKHRQRRFERHFPFLLELLALSMRAGLTFTAALQQACLQLPPGPVRQELHRVMRDVRTGKSRSEALHRLSDRVHLTSVTNFVAAVVQAEESGGSLGAVLADQARQQRQERFARAEKLANEAPVKMLLPLVSLLFPITFIIIGFPIALQFMESGTGGFLR